MSLLEHKYKMDFIFKFYKNMLSKIRGIYLYLSLLFINFILSALCYKSWRSFYQFFMGGTPVMNKLIFASIIFSVFIKSWLKSTPYSKKKFTPLLLWNKIWNISRLANFIQYEEWYSFIVENDLLYVLTDKIILACLRYFVLHNNNRFKIYECQRKWLVQ